MSQLKIVAVFTIKPEFTAAFQVEFNKLVAASRQEKGCIQYDLNQDINDINSYIFIETWQSQQAIDSHNSQLHFKNFAKFCQGKVVKTVVQVMQPLI